MIIEWPDIVETQNMVRARLRIHDRIQALCAGPEDLGPEVRRRVDNDVAIQMADQDRRAQPRVARVRRVADLAGTTDGRNARTGAGTEHRNLQGHQSAFDCSCACTKRKRNSVTELS